MHQVVQSEIVMELRDKLQIWSRSHKRSLSQEELFMVEKDIKFHILNGTFTTFLDRTSKLQFFLVCS